MSEVGTFLAKCGVLLLVVWALEVILFIVTYRRSEGTRERYASG